MGTGQTCIEELVTVLTGETNEIENEEDKNAEQLRLLMRKYYTVGGLTDVLSVFGPVKDDFVALGKMSKSRAVSIFRELKSGAGLNSGGSQQQTTTSPSKPPPDSTAYGGASGGGYNQPRAPSPNRQQNMPHLPPQTASAAAASGYGGYDQGSGGSRVPFEVIAQAQKLCRYANSALEHEDITTAINNCTQVLQLLKQYEQ